MSRDSVQVLVDSARVGTLFRDDKSEGDFLFGYFADTHPELAVSLTMPVRRAQYDSMNEVHPIFEMSLPEGYLRKTLESMFAKALGTFDSLDMLALLGQSQVGRIRYGQAGQSAEDVPEHDLTQLLACRGAEEYFDDLVQRYAKHSGVSGVQPKVLIRSAMDADSPKVTHKGATHIVKGFDPREYPELVLNEHTCMRAAKLAGLPAATTRMSENRSMLVVDRFDRAPDGTYLGFEDLCVLAALRTSGKYTGSYEDVAATLRLFVDPSRRASSMREFFSSLLLSCAVGNGDAHRKNFGILYDRFGVNVRLAPIYDVVCTRRYLPKDALALSLAGSKAFPDKESLATFARTQCGMTSRQTSAALDQVEQGVHGAIAELRAYVRSAPDARAQAEGLVQAINDSMTRIGLRPARFATITSVTPTSATMKARP